MFREYKDVLAPIPGRLHSKVKDLRLNRTIIARRINALSFDFSSDRSIDNNIHSSLKPQRRKKKASKLKYIDLWEISERFRRSISIPDKAVGNFSPKRSENWITFDSPSIHSGATTLRMKTWKRGEKKARFSFPSPLFRFGCLPPSPPLSPRSSKPLLSGWLRGVRTSVTHGLGRHEHREMISPWESCERALEKCGRQTAWRRLSWRGKERFLVRVCVQHCV